MTNTSLELRTGQHFCLTQNMQQAIKFLQLNHQELSEVLAQYMESNPLLERDEPAEEGSGEENFEEPREPSPLDDLYDADFDNYYPDDRRVHEKNSATSSSFSKDAFLNYSTQPSLRDFLLTQIATVVPDGDHPLAEAMVELLDDRGYLVEDSEGVITQEYGEVYSTKDIQRVIFQLQTLEPCGIFARNLTECLLIQLRDRGCDHPKMEEFLNIFHETKGDRAKITHNMGISLAQCHSLLELVTPLNPAPALSFGESITERVIPEILMKKDGGGGWSIELNPTTVHGVRFDKNYYDALKDTMKPGSDRTYLQEKFQESQWLLKSLQQRAMNMRKVAEVIVQKQYAFFESHRGSIKPLTLREVAEKANLSESTVSRITTGKYIQTPRGTLELKYFFSSVAGHYADDQSAKSVQEAIKKMIQEEDHERPLPDGEIAEKLSLQGMAIARRTVAKYREILGIDSLQERKRLYEWKHTRAQVLRRGA